VSARETVREKRLTAHETERLVRAMRDTPAARAVVSARAPEPSTEKDPNHAAVEEALQIALGTKVSIKRSGSGGKIEIEFYSADELEGVVERIIGKGSGA
jgi:ParB family chromosome partitioning protein